MLSKWSAKQNRRKKLQQRLPRRLWSSTKLGRAVLAAEQAALEQQNSSINQVIVELAALELPAALSGDGISIRAANSSWQVPLLASLESLPLVSRSVDVVIWRYLDLEWRTRRRLLADIVRVLVPGGTLITVALNPLDPRVWGLTGISNVSSQSAGSVNSIAKALGMQIVSNHWYGPGWWRLRPLQISRLQKNRLGGSGLPYLQRVRRRSAQPAVALTRSPVSRSGIKG